MKALVIGGGGFVGPYLVRHLTDDCGYEVTVTKTEKEQLVMDNASCCTVISCIFVEESNAYN